MAGDITTIARPYAEAVLNHATESGALQLWADRLDFLATIAKDQSIKSLADNPGLTLAKKAELVLEIGGDHLGNEGQNLVRLLLENNRFGVLPEIAKLYNEYKTAHEGTVDVEITAAYDLDALQEKALSDALQKKLDRIVNIHINKDPNLIGGFKLRTGDMVIDGSVSGQLDQLAHQLGI